MADALIVCVCSYQSAKCREDKSQTDSLMCAFWEVTINDLNFVPPMLVRALVGDMHISK